MHEVCRLVHITRQNPNAPNLTKRELLMLVSFLRIRENTLQELEKQVFALEKQLREKQEKPQVRRGTA